MPGYREEEAGSLYRVHSLPRGNFSVVIEGMKFTLHIKIFMVYDIRQISGDPLEGLGSAYLMVETVASP